ncbi:MAG: signal peptide peptidase SppA [Treponema sp.]|nr:signal peptide peptidase SppA [Treponema sp.]
MSDNKKSKKGLIVFLVILGVSVFIGIVGTVSYLVKNNFSDILQGFFDDSSNIASIPGKRFTSKNAKSIKNYGKEYIAALYVEGTIEEKNNDYDQQWLLSTIDELKNDKKNVAIAMYVDSPGGAVYQADEVYLALQDYKTEGKKIYVYMGPLAASGGYYISCPADQIYANRNTLTGSIGIIAGQSLDLTGLMEKAGIKSETIHAGKNKNMMNYNEPFTDEQKAIMQSIADEAYDQFTSVVSTCRGIPIERVEELADGRIYTAKQALENGLIDKIDSWDNMIDDLQHEIDNLDCRVIDFAVEKKTNFMNLLMESKAKAAGRQAAATLGIPYKLYEDLVSGSNYPAYIYKY